ncbi:hypothetical protein I3842_15G095300 [Carya illinoinensis]|uniref:Peptidase A1 domain-containing protein n=2 Tax=Carya illinoinensis TaxID=32201 RepID=A0A922AAF7_CARIL|nr:hypothetical protein I3842_15G095300 [Carya illinoinensis]
MMKWRTVSLLFMIFLLSICSFHGLVLAHDLPQEEPDMMRLELIHRHSPQLIGTVHGGPWPFKTRLERVKELVERDIVRHRVTISHKRSGQGRLSTRRKDSETSAEMPMSSGADYGTGQYFVQVKVGKPARAFLLIADAGSELTWVNCRYGCGSKNCNTHKGRLRNHRRVYLADRSSSFETIPCLSKMCKIELMNLFSLARCPTPSTPCAYDYSYLDGSAALGFFANDTITVGLTNGRKMMLENVLIGCTESTRGQGFKGADGVLGLGYGKHSFATKAAGKFGDKFSYCLVDHLSPKNISNQLIFGTNRNKHSLTRNIQHTKLLLNAIPPFYAVNILGISIGGVMLRIPTEVWDASLGGGTILDSGSSLTLLAEPAYNPVMTALQMSVSTYERLDLKPFEYCFKSTGFNESLVPRLVFHFTDGARFEPPVKSYIIDVAPESKCLGFVSVIWPSTSIIGNIMQQNNLWEFDLVRGTVGFAPSSCTCT